MILDQFPDASDLYSDIGAISRCAKVWSHGDDSDEMMLMMLIIVKFLGARCCQAAVESCTLTELKP